MSTDLTFDHLKAELELSERKRLMLKRRMVLDSFEAEDNSLWTMLDLITLILVFFIVLYSQPSSTAVKGVRNMVNPVVTRTEAVPLQVTHPEVIEKKALPEAPPVYRDDTLREQPFWLPSVEAGLRRVMAGADLSDYKIRIEKDRVRLVIGENISFPSGRAELLDHIKPVLIRLSDFLNEKRQFRIVVAGHTDNTPIHTQAFPSNWELSVARALSVAKFLMAFEVAPARISVQGFGEFQPAASNATAESRRENRRVEISLVRDDLS